MANQPGKYWALLTVLLLVVIIGVGAITIWLKHGGNEAIEISMPATPEPQGKVYIGGAVTNPGFYPLKNDDSLSAIIQGAGGTTGQADLSKIEILIPEVDTKPQSQLVNLNRADAWLLEALPGIGESRAKAIIDYRNRNGGFRNTNELLQVPGISTAIYEQIKNLVIVFD